MRRSKSSRLILSGEKPWSPPRAKEEEEDRKTKLQTELFPSLTNRLGEGTRSRNPPPPVPTHPGLNFSNSVRGEKFHCLNKVGTYVTDCKGPPKPLRRRHSQVLPLRKVSFAPLPQQKLTQFFVVCSEALFCCCTANEKEWPLLSGRGFPSSSSLQQYVAPSKNRF